MNMDPVTEVGAELRLEQNLRAETLTHSPLQKLHFHVITYLTHEIEHNYISLKICVHLTHCIKTMLLMLLKSEPLKMPI